MILEQIHVCSLFPTENFHALGGIGKIVFIKMTSSLFIREIFHALDANNDGCITEDEFVKGCLSDETFIKVTFFFRIFNLTIHAIHSVKVMDDLCLDFLWGI